MQSSRELFWWDNMFCLPRLHKLEFLRMHTIVWLWFRTGLRYILLLLTNVIITRNNITVGSDIGTCYCGCTNSRIKRSGGNCQIASHLVWKFMVNDDIISFEQLTHVCEPSNDLHEARFWNRCPSGCPSPRASVSFSIDKYKYVVSYNNNDWMAAWKKD